MRRGVALFALALATGCGGSPFEVTPAPAEVPTSDDAGGMAAQPIELATVDATPATPAPEAGPDIPAETGAEAEVDARPTEAEAAPTEAAPLPAEAGPTAPAILSPFRCVSPSMGYVACDSGGGWTLKWGSETCDANHPPAVGCLQGSPCAFSQVGGTPIEGTCEP